MNIIITFLKKNATHFVALIIHVLDVQIKMSW